MCVVCVVCVHVLITLCVDHVCVFVHVCGMCLMCAWRERVRVRVRGMCIYRGREKGRERGRQR